MLGVTNNIKDRPVYTPDEYTLFLLTDSLEDKSLYNIPFTNNGVTISNTITRDGRNSLYFLNTSDIRFTYTTTPIMRMFGRGSWTIEYWIYYASKTNSGGSATMVEIQQNPSKTDYNLLLWLNDGYLLYGMKTSGASWGNYNAIDTGIRMVAGQWVHHALVMNGEANNSKYFQNGILKSSQGDSASWDPAGGIFLINGRANSSYSAAGFTMNIQDFRISNVARYTANFTPPTRFI